MLKELWTVLTCLELGICYNLDNVILECDFVVVVYLLENLQVDETSESRLLCQIRLAKRRFSKFIIVHVSRNKLR